MINPLKILERCFALWSYMALFSYALMGRVDNLFAQEIGPENDPQAKPVPAVEFTHTEIQGIGWAFEALLQYPESERPFIRLVYMPPWATEDWITALDYAVNSACGQGPQLVKADIHSGGWILAYNLRALAPKEEQTLRLAKVWDSIANRDSVFHIPSTNLDKTAEKQNIVVLAPHLQAALAIAAKDMGKEKKEGKRIDELLIDFTNSPGAIYPAEFLVEQLLTSVKGKYPEFRQIEFRVKDKDVTPLENELRKHGFDVKRSRQLYANKSALIQVSDITGKNRIVETVPGLAGYRPLVSTFDTNDARIRPDEAFVRNPLEFDTVFDAQEIFEPIENGLIAFLLTNNKGEFQRVAPPNVVADWRKPDGHTKELEMGMSCIVCHTPGDARGYLHVRNDFEKLINSGADYFGDNFTYKNGLKISRQEALAIFIGRYSERIDDENGILGRARQDYEKAILALYPQDGKIRPNPVESLGETVRQIWHGYRYRKLDAQLVCLDMGIKLEKPETAAKVLRSLIPATKPGETEDVLIPLLKNGLQIDRDAYNGIRPEIARRAVLTRPVIEEQYRKRAGVDDVKKQTRTNLRQETVHATP